MQKPLELVRPSIRPSVRPFVSLPARPPVRPPVLFGMGLGSHVWVTNQLFWDRIGIKL